MQFKSKLIKAKIHKRYKRFLSDIELENGDMVCAHVPNTGSMTTCWAPGWDVYITHSDDPKRKLKYTLELTHNGETFICVNTGMTNKIVKEALELGIVKELKEYSEIKPEKKIYDSRLDFYLTGDGLLDAYVEVKNVTLLGEKKKALFPDSVSTRGQKHLTDLIKIKKDGHRAVMLYVLNRTDVDSFQPAKDIDPKYAELVKEAKEAGVEILAYQCEISTEEIILKKKIKVNL
ncbi:MAG: sugar fermentation stimulation protein A [Bacteriovoracaceae bacterium]|jgi:sugar fermentation stimulation protein A